MLRLYPISWKTCDNAICDLLQNHTCVLFSLCAKALKHQSNGSKHTIFKISLNSCDLAWYICNQTIRAFQLLLSNDVAGCPHLELQTIREAATPLNWTISEILTRIWLKLSTSLSRPYLASSVRALLNLIRTQRNDEDKTIWCGGNIINQPEGILKILRWIWGCFALLWFTRRHVPDVCFSSYVYCNTDCKL